MEEDRKISRRTFLSAAGGTIVSIGLPGVFVRLADANQRALAADLTADPVSPPDSRRSKEFRIWAALLEPLRLRIGPCASMVRWKDRSSSPTRNCST
jgi:hypothetical protein